MAELRKFTVFLAAAGVALALLAACKSRHEPLASVEDLMEDRLTRDGILLKCNDPAQRARMGTQCEIARVAVERLAKQDADAEKARAQEAFERNRDKLRTSDEQRAALQQQQSKVDPYSLPVVPVTPAASAAGSGGNP
jgi:hypothetical protein